MAAFLRLLSRGAPVAAEPMLPVSAVRSSVRSVSGVVAGGMTPKTPASSPTAMATPVAKSPSIAEEFVVAADSSPAAPPLPVLLGRTRGPFGLPPASFGGSGVPEPATAAVAGPPLPMLLGRTRGPGGGMQADRRQPRLADRPPAAQLPVLLGRTNFRPPARPEPSAAATGPRAAAEQAREAYLAERDHRLERRAPMLQI